MLVLDDTIFLFLRLHCGTVLCYDTGNEYAYAVGRLFVPTFITQENSVSEFGQPTLPPVVFFSTIFAFKANKTKLSNKTKNQKWVQQGFC